MYHEMYKIENTNWWFCAKRDIVDSIITKIKKDHKVSNIIDLGCGCGANLNMLAKHGTVTGVDYSDIAISYCRTHFDGALHNADLSKPIKNVHHKYDLAVVLDVLEHLPNDEIGLNNIRMLLEDHGICIVTVPAHKWLWTKHDENCMHYRRYNYNDLRELITNCGFDIVFMSYYNCILFPIACAVRFVSKLFSLNSKSEIENCNKSSIVNKVLYRIFLLEKHSLSKYKRLPYGLSLIAVITNGENQEEKNK